MGLIISRPKSKNAEWEDPPQDDLPYDYNATPSQFYFSLESVGNLEPDSIVQQGIKVLQQKLAAVLQELAGGDDANGNGAVGDMNAFEDGARTPDGDIGGDYGSTTPFNTGATSTWAGGATTPHSIPPYGVAPYSGTRWGS